MLSSTLSKSLAILTAGAGATLLAGCGDDDGDLVCIDSTSVPDEKVEIPVQYFGPLDQNVAENVYQEFGNSFNFLIEGRQRDRVGCSRVRVDNWLYQSFTLWVILFGEGRWDSHPICYFDGNTEIENHIAEWENIRFAFAASFDLNGRMQMVLMNDEGEESPSELTVPLYEGSSDCRPSLEGDNSFLVTVPIEPGGIKMRFDNSGIRRSDDSISPLRISIVENDS